MNEEQKIACDIALQGHNLIILGSAGTGKSFVVSQIAKKLINSGKKVQITCSTGISGAVYDSQFKVCTIHKFLGLLDGRAHANEIGKVVKNSPKLQYVVQNLEKIDCLIIDECSMISKRTLELINAVCQLKNSNKQFGGLQVILCGDFFQLPPVPNTLYQDNGDYCFESRLFNCFSHRVVLHESCRINFSETLLNNAINEVFVGKISKDSETFLINLRRPLIGNSTAIPTVKLFSTNNLVDEYNRNCLLNFTGPLLEFKSKDSGKMSDLKNIKAPQILWLKVGCPVVLLQNINDNLVNGLQGTLQSVTEGGPVVQFPTLNTVKLIPKVTFAVFSPSLNVNLAEREQYPLKPAFGLTIHKAQGMTLESVEIDCRGIFKPGQLGVALSRVTSSAGLRVINYHPRYIMKPEKTVTEFMKKQSQPIIQDLSCCRPEPCFHDGPDVQGKSDKDDRSCGFPSTQTQTPKISNQRASEQSVAAGESDCCGNDRDIDDIDDHELDDDFNKLLHAMVSDEEETLNFKLPPKYDINTLKEKLVFKKVVTPSQRQINEIVHRLNDVLLILFIKKVMLKMAGFILTNIPDCSISKGVPEKDLVKFYQSVHAYSTSADYKMSCLMLFENEDTISDDHLAICYDIVEHVRIFYVEEKVDILSINSGNVSRRYVTDSSKARVRYVAGYCVAKLRQKYIQIQKTNMYAKSPEGQERYYEAKCSVDILNLLKEDERFLTENTSHPDSLLDVQRRQNITCGLTNVTDNFFQLFMSFTDKCLSVFINENLLKFGKDMFSQCFEIIYSDRNLYERFVSIVFHRYSEENLDEFDFTQSENVDLSGILDNMVMKSALIHEVYTEVVKKYMLVLLSQFRKDVKSACKVQKKMAHRKQIKVSTGNSKMCSKAKQKQDIAKPTVSAMPEPTIADQSQKSDSSPVAGPSYIPDTVDESDMCKKCYTDKKDQWIQCDTCNGWFHRKCAGLWRVNLWREYSKDNAIWLCKDCE